MTDTRPRNESELIEHVRSIDVRAPEALHERVQSLIAERSSRPYSRRTTGAAHTGRRRFAGLAPRLTAAATVAAAALLIALIAGGGGGQLNARTAAALTLRAATLAAPRESPKGNAQLEASVEGISFPYWEEHFGWRASGARTDRVSGRMITTVFYADRSGRRIGYAIVAGSPAPPSSGGVVRWLHGMPYRVRSQDGAQVVTWQRDGRLCVVSGRGVSAATLVRLASWHASGAVAS